MLVGSFLKGTEGTDGFAKGNMQIKRNGTCLVEAGEQSLREIKLANLACSVPDILTELASGSDLPQALIFEILWQSERCDDFLQNPQAFFEQASECINAARRAQTIDGIKYLKLASQEYSVQEFFESEELLANLERTAVASEKSIYDHVVYEAMLRGILRKAWIMILEVQLFFKLPRSFKIATSIGFFTRLIRLCF